MPSRIPVHHPRHLPAPAARRAAYDATADRREAKRFYAGSRWRRLRAAILAGSPLCVDCRGRGRVTAAEHLHHVEARRTRPDLAFEPSNLMPLCEPCHSARTIRGE